MKSMLIDLNVVIFFLIFVQFSNSTNVYLIDNEGQMEKLDEPIHIDVEHTSKNMRDRLETQMAEFLLSKNYQPSIKRTMIHINDKKIITNPSRPRYYTSQDFGPVKFIDGRFVLNLDKIDVNDKRNDTSKIQFDSLRKRTKLLKRPHPTDYHLIVLRNGKKSFEKRFHVVDNKRKKKNKKKYASFSDSDKSKSSEEAPKRKKKKKRPKHSFESDNSKSIKEADLSEEKKKESRYPDSYEPKKKKKRPKYSSERDNSKSTKEADLSEEKKGNRYPDSYEQKKKKKRPKYSSEIDNSMLTKEGELSQEKKTEKQNPSSNEESSGYGEDVLYLQGNHLIDLKRKIDEDRTKRSSLKELDGRKRLPHFMPKRYHWNPDDIKHLGYFWFNGPRGKYPEAIPL